MQCRHSRTAPSRAPSEVQSSHKHGHKCSGAQQRISRDAGNAYIGAGYPMVRDQDCASDTQGQPNAQLGSLTMPTQPAVIPMQGQAGSEAHGHAASLRCRGANHQEASATESAACSQQADVVPAWQPPQISGLSIADDTQRCSPQHQWQHSSVQAEEPQVCGPKELTWEGVLHAASGSGQASAGAGDASTLIACSSALTLSSCT